MEVSSIRKSTQKNKLYMADVVYNGKSYKNQHFGDDRYQHYKDSTPLKLYSYLNHNDLDRRRLFHSRNKNNTGISSMLCKEFLW